MSNIAKILRLAADEHLWDGTFPRQDLPEYSCNAVDSVDHPDHEVVYDPKTFLLYLGLTRSEFGGGDARAFSEFVRGEERQSVRYAWLHFAADIADEWGEA